MNKRKDNKGRVLRKGESQRKDGTYMFRWTDFSKKRQCIYANNLNELRKCEQEILQMQAKGIRRDNITLNEQIEYYLDLKTNLKRSTKENYMFYYQTSIKGSLIGHMKLTDIRKSHILLFYKQCSEEKKYSNGTIAILQKIIHPAIQFAVDDDILIKNPSNGCMKEYIIEKEVKYALTFEEENEFISRLDLAGKSRFYKPLFCFILYTGLRIGETIGLTWDDIDMNNRTISVNHQLLYRRVNGKMLTYCESNAKTVSGNRKIPMSDKAYEYMKQQRKFWMQCKKDIEYEVDGYSNFVFISHITGRPITANSTRRILKRIVDMNDRRNIQLPKISPHILRHTMCTRLAEAGVDLKTIQFIMGQSDIRTTMSVYNHVNNDRIVAEVDKINSFQTQYTKSS